MADAEVNVLRADGAGPAGAAGLSILDPGSVLQALAANRQTGTFKLMGPSGEEALVYLQDGAIRLAGSPPDEYGLLEETLFKARLASREELDRIRRAAHAAGRTVAEQLVADGRFEADRLRGLLARQVTERAADLLAWKGARCEFFPGQFPGERLKTALADFVPAIGVAAALEEAGRRAEQWERIRAVFDPAAEVFELAENAGPVEGPPARRELLGLIDGRRDVGDLVAASTLSALEACGELLEMLEQGLVRAKGPGDLARLGDLAAAGSDWPKARRLLRTALEKDGSRTELLVKLAAACEALGDGAGARAHLRAFVSRSMEQSHFAEAVGGCRRLVELDPEDPEPRARLFRALREADDRGALLACGRELVLLYEKQGAGEAAAELVARLRELSPDDTDLLEMDARLRLARAERVEALVEYEKLAQSYMEHGDLQSAVRTFHKIVYEIDEECLEGRIWLAECLITLGRTEEAVVEYNKLAGILTRTGVISETTRLPFALRVNGRIAELDPKNIGARQWLAETFAATKDRAKALASFGQILAILEQAGDGRQVLATLRRAGELFPDELGYRERLADLYRADRDSREKAKAELAEICRLAAEQEDFALGTRAAGKMLLLDPFHMGAHGLLAQAFLARGQHGAAAQKFLWMARTYLGVGLDDQAEGVLRAVLEIDDELAEAHRLLARRLDARGKGAEAVGHYRQAGVLACAETNFGQARADLMRARELDPKDTTVARMLLLLPVGLQPGKTQWT